MDRSFLWDGEGGAGGMGGGGRQKMAFEGGMFCRKKSKKIGGV